MKETFKVRPGDDGASGSVDLVVRDIVSFASKMVRLEGVEVDVAIRSAEDGVDVEVSMDGHEANEAIMGEVRKIAELRARKTGTNLDGTAEELILEAAEILAADWRGQEIRVRGRMMHLGSVEGGKLYHGSPHDLPNGTMLSAGKVKNYDQSGDVVSVTSILGTAKHWGSLEGNRKAFVYEVEPVGEVDVWRVGLANYGENIALWEGRVRKAKVLRKV